MAYQHGSGWRKDVVNQCLEFACEAATDHAALYSYVFQPDEHCMSHCQGSFTLSWCVCVFVCLFVFDTIDAALARDKIDSLCIPLEFLKTENKGLTLILARHRLKTKVCEHTSPVRIPLFQWLV